MRLRKGLLFCSVISLLGCDKYKEHDRSPSGMFYPNGCAKYWGWKANFTLEVVDVTICDPVKIIAVGTLTQPHPFQKVEAEVARLKLARGDVHISTRWLQATGRVEYNSYSGNFAKWKRNHPILTTMLEILFILVLIGIAGAVFSKRGEIAEAHEKVKECKANIVSSLQNQHTLLTGLFTIALGYKDYEATMIREVDERSLIRADKFSRAVAVVSQLGTSYPQLRTNETYQTLMGQLHSVVNDVNNRFELHNKAVASLNAKLRTVTGSFAGATLGIPSTLEMLDSSKADQLLPLALDLNALKVLARPPRSTE